MSGTGKTTILKDQMLSDIAQGDGVLFIDPHGHDTDDVLGRIPRHRVKDVLLFDPSDYEHPIAWNPLADVPGPLVPYVASTIVDTFKDAWGYGTMITPTLDQYLYNTTAALIEVGEPLIGIKYMLTSDKYRRRVLKRVCDPVVYDFWTNDFEDMTDRERRDTTRSTLNKIGALISDARIRHVIGQSRTAFSVPEIIDQRRVFFARLPQGRLGIQKTRLLGSLLLTQFHQAALARSTDSPFHIYLDELHHWQGQTLIEMMSGIRKFNVSLTVAHQYLDQLAPTVLAAVHGNTARKIIFRVSRSDGDRLNDLTRDNQMLFELHAMPAFHYRLITPEGITDEQLKVELPPYRQDVADRIRAGSRRHYAQDRSKVAEYIDRFLKKT